MRWNILAGFLGWLYRREEIRELPRVPLAEAPGEDAGAALRAHAGRDPGRDPRGPSWDLSRAGADGAATGRGRRPRHADYHDGWLTLSKARKGDRLDAPIRSTKTGKGEATPRSTCAARVDLGARRARGPWRRRESNPCSQEQEAKEIGHLQAQVGAQTGRERARARKPRPTGSKVLPPCKRRLAVSSLGPELVEALGDALRPEVYRRLRVAVRSAGLLLLVWLRGDARPSPFFDQTGAPVSEPLVLGPQEREALRPQASGQPGEQREPRRAPRCGRAYRTARSMCRARSGRVRRAAAEASDQALAPARLTSARRGAIVRARQRERAAHGEEAHGSGSHARAGFATNARPVRSVSAPATSSASVRPARFDPATPSPT